MLSELSTKEKVTHGCSFFCEKPVLVQIEFILQAMSDTNNENDFRIYFNEFQRHIVVHLI